MSIKTVILDPVACKFCDQGFGWGCSTLVLDLRLPLVHPSSLRSFSEGATESVAGGATRSNCQWSEKCAMMKKGIDTETIGRKKEVIYQK